LAAGCSVRDARSPFGKERGHLGRGVQRARRPLSVWEGARLSWPRRAAGETPALRLGRSAAILAAVGSVRDARSPFGTERGHLGRGVQRARRPLSVWEGARPSWPRWVACETPALRSGRSAAILAAGQRASRPLSVWDGARPSWPRWVACETPALRLGRSAAVLAAVGSVRDAGVTSRSGDVRSSEPVGRDGRAAGEDPW